jgi:nucleoside phosphorylase
MGLCGSLTPQLRAGNVALYSDCVYHPTSHPSPLTFDSSLTSAIQEKLGEQATCVKALTTDRVICSAVEKRSLASYAEVVDMEGYAALEFLKALGISVASLRVVSDGCQHDLPDLSKAISPDGVLQPYALTSCMIRRPIAAARLIYGSLIGLSVLQKLTTAVMFGTIDENYFRLK